MSEGSFLTRRQQQVLKLRALGLSQEEVAAQLGTTRSNVSILESRAHRKIDRAARTIEQWRMIQAPIKVSVPKGTDLFNIPAIIFSEADSKGFKLPVTSVDIIVQLRTKAPEVVQRRALDRDIEICVMQTGELLIDMPVI